MIEKSKLTPARLYLYHLGKVLPYASMYGFILLAMLLLAYFVPFTLILSLPFIIIPFTFALHVSIASINGELPYSLGFFFKNFKLYYTLSFFGVFKITKGLLKALGVFLLIYAVFGSIHLSIFLNNDPGYLELVKTSLNINALYEYVMNNETYLLIVDIYLAVAILGALIILIHHLVLNSLKISVNIHSKNPAPMMSLNAFHKDAMKYFNKNFYNDYFKRMPIIYVLFGCLYAGGYLINYFFISKDNYQCITFGLIAAFIIFIFIIPYIIDMVEVILLKNFGSYLSATLKATNNFFKKVNETNLTEEERKQFQELEESINKSLKEDEIKDDPSEESSDNDNKED